MHYTNDRGNRSLGSLYGAVVHSTTPPTGKADQTVRLASRMKSFTSVTVARSLTDLTATSYAYVFLFFVFLFFFETMMVQNIISLNNVSNSLPHVYGGTYMGSEPTP